SGDPTALLDQIVLHAPGERDGATESESAESQEVREELSHRARDGLAPAIWSLLGRRRRLLLRRVTRSSHDVLTGPSRSRREDRLQDSQHGTPIDFLQRQVDEVARRIHDHHVGIGADIRLTFFHQARVTLTKTESVPDSLAT